MKLPKSTIPFSFGAAAGAVILVFLAMSNGWVVTAEVNRDEVQDAWINAQASVCAARAAEHVKGMEKAPDLQGYQADAREARDGLAKEFATALPGKETPESIVVSACSQMLNKTL
ncbi:MAG: hypothetical protein RIB80_03980 [Rhodospirillales bacterium]